jgi:phosphoribosyl 1,2-cyclic phosphodiesterase
MATAQGPDTGDMAGDELTLKFWGVRGSIPVSSRETVRAGGDTSCVEVRCGGRIIFFDAGSGLRLAGLALREENIGHSDIFLTHAHWDHLVGLPFFKPLFTPKMHTTLWAGHLAGKTTTRALVEDLMRRPFFPVGTEVFCGQVEYRDFDAGETIGLGECVLRTRPLEHPGGAVGYRLEYGGKAIAYVTDTEHQPGQLDPAILELIADAELMIYDCTYTEAEFAEFRGYGHSTWNHGVELCRAANTKRLAMFHHHPTRTDEILDQLENQAREAFAGAFAARDGLVLKL